MREGSAYELLDDNKPPPVAMDTHPTTSNVQEMQSKAGNKFTNAFSNSVSAVRGLVTLVSH